MDYSPDDARQQTSKAVRTYGGHTDEIPHHDHGPRHYRHSRLKMTEGGERQSSFRPVRRQRRKPFTGRGTIVLTRDGRRYGGQSRRRPVARPYSRPGSLRITRRGTFKAGLVRVCRVTIWSSRKRGLDGEPSAGRRRRVCATRPRRGSGSRGEPGRRGHPGQERAGFRGAGRPRWTRGSRRVPRRAPAVTGMSGRRRRSSGVPRETPARVAHGEPYGQRQVFDMP